jgi:hypothetical protein
MVGLRRRETCTPIGKKSPSNNVSVATMILLEQSGDYFYCHLLGLEKVYEFCVVNYCFCFSFDHTAGDNCCRLHHACLPGVRLLCCREPMGGGGGHPRMWTAQSHLFNLQAAENGFMLLEMVSL